MNSKYSDTLLRFRDEARKCCSPKLSSTLRVCCRSDSPETKALSVSFLEFSKRQELFVSSS
ncbi:unnamed protein product [Haemonchus placei]|uniref:Uncharacterized protein n=1 Tax=Haemonchus placei TaxID=6290 RepID=A0A0N4WLH6_HAEPC|nr:unnamed protein product [Haemonchus placei]